MTVAVLDTNVLASAAMGGSCRRILELWRADRFRLVVSTEILKEYEAVLHRPKFRLPAAAVADIMNLVLRKATHVIRLVQVSAVKDDPSDNVFLEAAIAGTASVVVSGDGHLLGLREYQGIRILSSAQFLAFLDSE